MKKILAVSGGLDSMVLLHKFRDDKDAVIAHFNHGTRPSASDDQAFVEHWAKQYGKPFITETANLGKNISEADARAARYDFLFRVAETYDAKIFTAHHADDMLETIAINLLRGTGWRGIAPFGHQNIERPLLKFSKNQLREYAAKHQLVYREDPTNNEEHYLRNRLRQRIPQLEPAARASLLTLATRQTELKVELEKTLAEILPADGFYLRAWFNDLPDNIAIEFLHIALSKTNSSATRPKLQEFLQAIRTYAPGKQFNLPNGRLIRLHKDHFML